MHWTLTLSQDLQVFMSQCTPPTFPFTSALPISFNRPGLFGRGEKSNAKYRGTYAQIFHRVGLDVFFFFFFLNYKGARRKCKFQGNLCPIFFSEMYELTDNAVTRNVLCKCNKDMHINFILNSQFTLFKHLYMCK